MRSQVKYANRLNVGEVLVRRDDAGTEFVPVQKIQTARGRKPRRGGSTLLVQVPGAVLRLNTQDPVRVVAGAAARS